MREPEGRFNPSIPPKHSFIKRGPVFDLVLSVPVHPWTSLYFCLSFGPDSVETPLGLSLFSYITVYFLLSFLLHLFIKLLLFY